ncbi:MULTISPECIES: hypothetical protein [unclassified Paenibacillus]|uniref:hypothetical protein n=1 Tax=unclassified Paenibacillus TaxID=185978 RepID=UPI001AE7AF55|nr:MULTISPECIES: hypothetical protein [unclassified Paenibacillus]MBP1157746.1 hypothetical protein [Paenibacillus sp. PvP091]MBP1171518.1 hypothetical protein [Paenibacillus sp. PvR098]MBP2442546.1 hypothetical protein [Paenibacillus sp. PvP052]
MWPFSRSTWNTITKDNPSAELERRIAELERKLQEQASAKPEEPRPTVVIEHIAIDKLVVEKWDHSNNFGALGIKELGGKLNIGVNYSGPIDGEVLKDFFPKAKTKPESKDNSPQKTKPGTTGSSDGPSCTIRAKNL